MSETVKVEAKKKTANSEKVLDVEKLNSTSPTQNLAKYGILAGGLYVAFVFAALAFCISMCCATFLGFLFTI